MGIKGLSQFLRKKAPIAFAGIPVKKLDVPQKVAVDVPLFLHKFFYSAGRNQVGSCFQKLKHSMIQYNFQPVWVFDGAPLALKDNERKKRSENREKYKKVIEVNPQDSFVVMETHLVEVPTVEVPTEISTRSTTEDAVFDAAMTRLLQDDGNDDEAVKRFLNHVALVTQESTAIAPIVLTTEHPTSDDYIRLRQTLPADDIVYAKHEAEALCSYMVSTGDAYAALSDDSDTFAYNCPRVILGASRDLRFARVIHMSELLKELQMNSVQFRRMCVMCGNDFVENEKGKGPVGSYKSAKDNIEFSGSFAEVDNVFESYCFESNGMSEGSHRSENDERNGSSGAIKSDDETNDTKKRHSESDHANVEDKYDSGHLETRSSKRAREV